jgi:hypothetical protein
MFGVLRDLWTYIHSQRKYWLMPIVVTMILVGGLVVLSKGSAVAPFLYALF